MRRYKVLTVCGTGIATSTVAAEKTKEMLKTRGLNVEVVEAKASEVASKVQVFNPDVIIHTTPVSESAAAGIKMFRGLQFLTGIGMDKLADEIAGYLKSLE
ncbi:PTS sugar transporter subunit IIB [Geosporobacter ferrireducens]|uniref:MtlR transcriptional regulator n=1 Tax=Geosporobacter ferrireducens TaxID=1424294 RepID=A0A1D8GP10_9FIRM|nr:PTS sugar transporter subunit IIB [Geosporobacter ferrireducens]AOT72633.1 MtlR transcriptional regulator [Geosporobacter ferrireducens]MTI55035.1 MtlR transcriptional regulator [Geosporobacter ferrireducens]